MTEAGIPKLRQQIRNKAEREQQIKERIVISPLGDTLYVKVEDVFAVFEEVADQLEKRISSLDLQRRKNLESMNDFYERLPKIKDAKIAMVEFKAHNDDLIDYIIELEALVKTVLEALR